MPMDLHSLLLINRRFSYHDLGGRRSEQYSSWPAKSLVVLPSSPGPVRALASFMTPPIYLCDDHLASSSSRSALRHINTNLLVLSPQSPSLSKMFLAHSCFVQSNSTLGSIQLAIQRAGMPGFGSCGCNNCLFSSLQTVSGANPTFYPMVSRCSFPWGKIAVA
jgi:hypothetical protein